MLARQLDTPEMLRPHTPVCLGSFSGSGHASPQKLMQRVSLLHTNHSHAVNSQSLLSTSLYVPGFAPRGRPLCDEGIQHAEAQHHPACEPLVGAIFDPSSS